MQVMLQCLHAVGRATECKVCFKNIFINQFLKHGSLICGNLS